MPKQKTSRTYKEKAEEEKDNAIWWQDSKTKGLPQRILTAVLFLLILAILGLGIWMFGIKSIKDDQQANSIRKELEDSKKKTQDNIDSLQQRLSDIQVKLDSAEKAKGQTANQKVSIEGSLSYPSDSIPQDMEVCAVDVNDAKNTICTKDHITDKKYTYGVGYKLELAPGAYNVYATTSFWQGYKAYYDEFVTCGMKYSCQSHNALEVKVEAGKNLTDIDPIDWYKQG